NAGDFDALTMKGRTLEACLPIYEALVETIDVTFDFTTSSIETALRAFCTAQGVKPRDLFMPVRLMVTGKQATPPLFETMAVLGRQRCQRRMREALRAMQQHVAQTSQPEAPEA